MNCCGCFLITAIDFIRIGLTKNSPISKYFFDLWVEAPQYLSSGTLILPMLSYSFLSFMNIVSLSIHRRYILILAKLTGAK